MMLFFRQAKARPDLRRKTVVLYGLLLVLSLAVYSGCNKKNRIGLDVDLYLYPEAASGDDLLLQTAIRKQLFLNTVTQNSVIHARVVDKIVFLTGSVGTQHEKDEADRLARETTVTVNGVSLKSSEVRNSISVGT